MARNCLIEWMVDNGIPLTMENYKLAAWGSTEPDGEWSPEDELDDFDLALLSATS